MKTSYSENNIESSWSFKNLGWKVPNMDPYPILTEICNQKYDTTMDIHFQHQPSNVKITLSILQHQHNRAQITLILTRRGLRQDI